MNVSYFFNLPIEQRCGKDRIELRAIIYNHEILFWNIFYCTKSLMRYRGCDLKLSIMKTIIVNFKRWFSNRPKLTCHNYLIDSIYAPIYVDWTIFAFVRELNGNSSLMIGVKWSFSFLSIESLLLDFFSYRKSISTHTQKAHWIQFATLIRWNWKSHGKNLINQQSNQSPHSHFIRYKYISSRVCDLVHNF